MMGSMGGDIRPKDLFFRSLLLVAYAIKAIMTRAHGMILSLVLADFNQHLLSALYQYLPEFEPFFEA